MLTDNRRLLKNLNEVTYARMQAYEQALSKSSIVIEQARNGYETLAIWHEGKLVQIHSKYDPQREVDTFLQRFPQLADSSHIFIIGLGLGYHISQIVAQNPSVKLTIYEPNEAILFNYLQRNKLTNNISEVFVSLHDLKDLEQLAKNFTDKTITIVWPSYLRLYGEEIQETQQNLVKLLKHTRDSLGVNVSFQHRWIVNSLLNYPKTIKTSNIISVEYQKVFDDKPVIIVAAGPSLNEELPLLKAIKEEESAYIFAVGSAINALLHAQITPHAVFSYDPEGVNQNVILKIKEKNITNIPLVFGTSVGCETIMHYPGKLIHMVTSADTLSSNILRISPKVIIEDSPSIAVMTLQVVKKLNMAPIILVGQNLGYVNDTYYAQGIQYKDFENNITEEQKKKMITVKDVHGHDMLTNESFMRMKRGLEITIQKYPYGRVINTTRQGVHIHGTEYTSLAEVRKTYLTERNITTAQWVVEKPEYAQGLEKFEVIMESFKQMLVDIDVSVKWANKIVENYEAKLYNSINSLILEFNKVFKKVIECDAHQFIIKAGIKVQHQKFNENYRKIDFEKNPKKRAEKFIEISYTYLGSVYELAAELIQIMRATDWQIKTGKEVTIE